MRNLEEVRQEIDTVSEEMVRSFLKRMECSREVVEYKIREGLPIFDENREQALLDEMMERCHPGAMEPFARDFLKALMEISRKYQQELMNEGS